MCLIPITVGPNATIILGGKRIQIEGEMMERLLKREGEHLTAGLRPEHWHLAPSTNRNLKAKVSHCERLGNEQILTCQLKEGSHLIQVRSTPEFNVSGGDEISLESDPTAWRLFENDGEAIK